MRYAFKAHKFQFQYVLYILFLCLSHTQTYFAVSELHKPWSLVNMLNVNKNYVEIVKFVMFFMLKHKIFPGFEHALEIILEKKRL